METEQYKSYLLKPSVHNVNIFHLYSGFCFFHISSTPFKSNFYNLIICKIFFQVIFIILILTSIKIIIDIKIPQIRILVNSSISLPK